MAPIDAGTPRHWGGAEARATPRPTPQAPVRPAAPAVMAPLPSMEALTRDPPPADTLTVSQGDRDDALIAQSYVEGLQKTIFTAADMMEAFLAGIAYLRQQVKKDPAFEGTVVSRTVVAALEFFLSQVLPQSQEEVKSGEWMRAEELQALIAEIRAKGDLQSVAW